MRKFLYFNNTLFALSTIVKIEAAASPVIGSSYYFVVVTFANGSFVREEYTNQAEALKRLNALRKELCECP